jgi:ketosteroid isomerase-like protein
MKVKTIAFPVLLLFFSVNLKAQSQTTLTDSLVKSFNKAWNNEDIPKMISLLDSSAFFKSPYQLRYSRDTMAATVLITNPPVYKVAKQTELYSHVENNIAWSIGKVTADIYDKNGKTNESPLNIDYLFVFVRKNSDWKLQMMIFHE